jgi:hypothetical protein
MVMTRYQIEMRYAAGVDIQLLLIGGRIVDW